MAGKQEATKKQLESKERVSPERLFDLTGRVAIITGGAGLLGSRHAEAIAGAGGVAVLVDIEIEKACERTRDLVEIYKVPAGAREADITDEEQVQAMLDSVIGEFGKIDILINNAARNPKVEDTSEITWSRLENFPLAQWHADIAVGLTGAFLCSKIVGNEMARRGSGVIVNIASDLSVIAPDQRIYRQPGLPDDQQPVKPISYSVVKTGLIGLTRYLATYWAEKGVRVNAISPGGVYNEQDEDFVTKLSNLIPLGRMARIDEYQGALLFLCSDASSYMTGANLVIDGGRSVW